MRVVVLDASVALAWCLSDERSVYAERVVKRIAGSSQAVVPAIWPLEVANGLLVAERQARMSRADVTLAAELLNELDVRMKPQLLALAMGETLNLARQYGLSTYDATYLHLAMHEGAELATLDKALGEAARQAGVGVCRA